jgi:hypothetical protein
MSVFVGGYFYEFVLYREAQFTLAKLIANIKAKMAATRGIHCRSCNKLEFVSDCPSKPRQIGVFANANEPYAF